MLLAQAFAPLVDDELAQAARKIPPFTVKLPYGNKYDFDGNRVGIGLRLGFVHDEKER